jgi:hypothetical protein
MEMKEERLKIVHDHFRPNPSLTIVPPHDATAPVKLKSFAK